MSQTESEFWAGLAKSDEAGQLVYSGPTQDPREAIQREMYDRGWEDLGFLGVGPGYYRGSATGLALAIQCADVKARDISKADMLQWRRKGRGWTMVDNPTPGSVAYRLMTKPNATSMTWVELWRMIVLHLELAQNAYVYTPRTIEGDIEEYIPIMPGRARMRVSTGGRIFYEIVAATEYDLAVLGDTYLIVPEEEVIHFRGRLLDGINGLSNVLLGSPIFALLSAIGAFQTKLFGNDGRQPLVFQTKDGFPTTEAGNAAFRRLKDQLREAARKASNGEAILLEAGLEAKTVAVNSEQAETTDAFTQQVMRICGLMDVPPHRIYALEAVAYNNMAAMNRQYVNDVLMPLATNIEVKFRNHTLPEREWPTNSVQFDRSALMSNDPETVEKLVKAAMNAGLMTFDEGREALPFRLNPLKKGGDQRTVPVNMSLIGPDGDVIHVGTGQNPTNPGAGQEESPDNNAGKTGPRLVHDAGAA